MIRGRHGASAFHGIIAPFIRIGWLDNGIAVGISRGLEVFGEPTLVFDFRQRIAVALVRHC